MVTRRKSAGIAAIMFFICAAIAFSQNARERKGTRPYRGMRMSDECGLFYVTKIESENEENDYIDIEIKFNMPPDPRTLRNESVLINGKPLPSDVRIAFNKAGTKIKILLRRHFIFDTNARRDRMLQIDLPDAKSFNAIPLYRTYFPDLKIEREYEFRFVHTMRKKMNSGMHCEMHSIPSDDRGNDIHTDSSAHTRSMHTDDVNAVICGEYLRFEER